MGWVKALTGPDDINLFRFPPDIIVSSDILKNAFYAIRPTFLTGFTMPNWRLWNKREISRLCAYATEEYCGVYNPKKKTLLSFGNHFHVGYTLHRAFKVSKIKHTYREIGPSDPEYLKILMEHTNVHCLALLKSVSVAVQSKRFPSDENLTFVQDEIANLRSWFRSNARCWWLFDQYVAVQNLTATFNEMVIESNRSKMNSAQKMESHEIAELSSIAFRSIENNRPRDLLKYVRMENSPLSRAEPEVEYRITVPAERLVSETKVRAESMKSRSRGNVAKKAMSRISKSYRRSSRAQKQIVSAIYDYFGVLPF